MPRPVQNLIPSGPIRLSVEDYMAISNDGRRYQLIDGVLDVTPSPIPRHQQISKRLEVLLLRALEETGLGEVFHAPIDVILDDNNVVQPDILFIRADRARIVGPKNIQGAPDLVIEILSESSRRIDVRVKSELYARFGVGHYWVVDPDIDRIDFYRLDSGAYVLAATSSAPATAEPPGFPGVTLPLAAIFK